MLFSAYKLIPFKVDSFWAGWDDEENDGTFADANTGEPLTSEMFKPFYPGEPNGGTLENCVMVWALRDAWNDLSCDRYLTGFCHVHRKPRFKIRG